MAGEPLSTEGQIVIEEKQGKPNGEVSVVQYIRGNFLGKVRILSNAASVVNMPCKGRFR